jgi:hypothetical protein
LLGPWLDDSRCDVKDSSQQTSNCRDRKGPGESRTFNINNINKRLDNLLGWLAKAEPDVVSLQELKAEQEDFPGNALRTLGYEPIEKDSSAIGENGPLKQSWCAFGVQPLLPK